MKLQFVLKLFSDVHKLNLKQEKRTWESFNYVKLFFKLLNKVSPRIFLYRLMNLFVTNQTKLNKMSTSCECLCFTLFKLHKNSLNSTLLKLFKSRLIRVLKIKSRGENQSNDFDNIFSETFNCKISKFKIPWKLWKFLIFETNINILYKTTEKQQKAESFFYNFVHVYSALIKC